MSLPRGSFARPFLRPVPGSPPSVVLAVGWRFVASNPGGGSGRVRLTDSDGTTVLATIARGSEVEILAWQPQRSGAARYRVLATRDRVEGWLGAANLAPHSRPARKEPAKVSARPGKETISPKPRARVSKA